MFSSELSEIAVVHWFYLLGTSVSESSEIAINHHLWIFFTWYECIRQVNLSTTYNKYIISPVGNYPSHRPNFINCSQINCNFQWNCIELIFRKSSSWKICKITYLCTQPTYLFDLTQWLLIKTTKLSNLWSYFVYSKFAHSCLRWVNLSTMDVFPLYVES